MRCFFSKALIRASHRLEDQLQDAASVGRSDGIKPWLNMVKYG